MYVCWCCCSQILLQNFHSAFEKIFCSFSAPINMVRVLWWSTFQSPFICYVLSSRHIFCTTHIRELCFIIHMFFQSGSILCVFTNTSQSICRSFSSSSPNIFLHFCFIFGSPILVHNACSMFPDVDFSFVQSPAFSFHHGALLHSSVALQFLLCVLVR